MSTLLDLPALSATQAKFGLSERYQFYSTRELIAPLLADSWEVTQSSQVRSKIYNPFGKHLLRLSHPRLQLGEQRLEALIKNSHDGTSRCEFALGAWRFICSNGLVIGSTLANVAIPHLRPFDIVQAKAQELIEHSSEITAVFDAWRAKQLSRDEQRALAISAATIRWPKTQPPPVRPEDLLEVRRVEDKGNDLWTVFNRLQEAVTHGGTAHLNDRRYTRSIRSIDETLRVNKALWLAAESVYSHPGGIALPS